MSMNKPHLMNEATKEENERDVALLRAETHVLPIKYKHARSGSAKMGDGYVVQAIDEYNQNRTIAYFPFKSVEVGSQESARIMAQQLADKINWG